jgi:diacylglycerol kinase (ATP)
MANQPLKGMPRLQAAYRNSMRGFKDIWQGEEAFRIECVVFLLSVPCAFWIGGSVFQAALLIGAVLVLLIVEILNSAIEATIDRIGPERHELSRMAKDLGSLAVLLASGLVLLIWAAALAERVFA